jgi:hypothetical protein
MLRHLSALLLLALVACGDPTVGLDGTRLDGPQYFRATVGGEPWAAEWISAFDSFGRGGIQESDGVGLSLNGSGPAQSKRSRQLQLYVTRATLGVPVPTDGIAGFVSIVTMALPSGDTAHVELALPGPDATGSITLTAYDPIRRRLAGRFDFKAPLTVRTITSDSEIIEPSGSIVTVSDGEFLVDLAP